MYALFVERPFQKKSMFAVVKYYMSRYPPSVLYGMHYLLQRLVSDHDTAYHQGSDQQIACLLLAKVLLMECKETANQAYGFG